MSIPRTDLALTTVRLQRRMGTLGLGLALVLLCAGAAVLAPNFLTGTNLAGILRQIAIQAVVATGVTALVIAGYIDLSLGNQLAFASALTGLLGLRWGWPLPLAMLTVAAVGAAVGWLNGYITLRWRIPDFITTLATMTILSGAALQLTGGYPISGFPGWFSFLGQGAVLGIPVSALVMAAVYAAGHVWLTQTRSGQYVFFVGDSRETARSLGVRANRTILGVFTLVGLLCALSGILLSARLMSASPVAGSSWTLDIIAGVFVGGTIFGRPKGSLVGTLLGTVFIGVLTNAMILLNISPYIQLIVRGGVILAAVWLNTISHRNQPD